MKKHVIYIALILTVVAIVLINHFVDEVKYCCIPLFLVIIFISVYVNKNKVKNK